MSESLFDAKKRFEDASFEAYKKKDYVAAYKSALEAAKLTMQLRDQCTGALYQAYEKDAESLVGLAESFLSQSKGIKTEVSGVNQDQAGEIKSAHALSKRPDVRLEDVAGMEDVKKQIRLRMIEPLKRPEDAKKHGLKLGGGILLYGPPGTGKTFVAKAVAGELNLPFFSITSADVLGMYVGESPKNIRAIFREARKNPLSIIFIDELESIFKKRDSNIHETTQQVITVLLQELDGIESDQANPILLIGATNVPSQVDPAFLRSGRFDIKAYVGLPEPEARKKIILNAFKKALCPLEPDALDYLIEATEGFSGADITGFAITVRMMAFDKGLDRYTKDLCIAAREEVFPSCSDESIKKIIDWEESFGITRGKKKIVNTAQQAPVSVPEPPKTQESAPKPEQSPAAAPAPKPAPKPAQTPVINKKDVTLDDIKGLKDAKEIVYDSLINPILYPEVYNTLGVIPSKGLLLYGPPGTGKTMFGRAIANELDVEFIPVTLADVRGKTSLQTVQLISQLFAKARSCPRGCVLFLDDCEEVLARPGSSKSSGVSQFLNELDGLKKNAGSKVFVLIATNRPRMIDGALLRSGRISASVYVGLPDKETRKEIILTAITDNVLADDVDIDRLAELTEGYSCAEIFHKEKGGGICNLARTLASRRWVDRIKKNPAEKEIVEPLCWKDFENALASVTPSSVRDASRIAEIERFREMYTTRIVDESDNEPEEVSITAPDVEVLKNIVFSSATIQNTPDYKHFADNVRFMYNDEYSDSSVFNAYATVVGNVLEKYGIEDEALAADPERPAIVLCEGLNLVYFAFAAFYLKYNPSYTLEHPEMIRDFLIDMNGYLHRNDSRFTMENLKELNAKYELFSEPSENESIKALSFAMTAMTIAHELGHIVYGDIFKIGTGSAYARNMERSADEFAVDVINGIEEPSVREILTLGAALSFVADAALGGADSDIPVESEISHPATLERFKILLEKTGDAPARYNLTEESFLECIP